MSEKKDQNNGVEVTTADKIPQADEPAKKENILVRARRTLHRKYLQFKATPVGRWVVRGGKVAEGVLAVYGLYEFIDKRKPEETEAVITCGEIVDEPETEPMEEEPAEEEVNEEHD